ncbi:MAG TPA: hypothetical protein V6C88_19355, partial [Chroococcidiopsis sp.]
MATSFSVLLLDWITALWVTILAAIILIGLPVKSVHPAQQWPLPWLDRVLSALPQAVLWLVVGVLGLSALSLFNWFTLALWYGAGLLLFRLSGDRLKTLHQMQQWKYRAVYFLFDLLDHQVAVKFPFQLRGLNFHHPPLDNEAKFNALGHIQRGSRRSPPLLGLFIFTLILGFTLLLRYEYPLLQLRFSDPEAYPTLLAIRQILAGGRFIPPAATVYTAIAAALSLLGSVDPMQVMRFLSPLLSVVTVLSVGYLVYRLTRHSGAAIASLFSLGAYVFTVPESIPETLPLGMQHLMAGFQQAFNQGLVQQWMGTEPSLGALFVVLSLIQIQTVMHHRRRRAAWVSALCCVAIATLASPAFIILIGVGSLGLLIHPWLALALLTASWIGLAGVDIVLSNLDLSSILTTVYLSLSLLVGLGFAVIERSLRIVFQRHALLICLIVSGAIAVNFLLPISPNITYLEYERSARKALELSTRLSPQQWLIVAPIEQFHETYGRAWYEDLNTFVDRYEERVQDPQFQFPYTVPDLFIFVEKRPFKT